MRAYVINIMVVLIIFPVILQTAGKIQQYTVSWGYSTYSCLCDQRGLCANCSVSWDAM